MAHGCVGLVQGLAFLESLPTFKNQELSHKNPDVWLLLENWEDSCFHTARVWAHATMSYSTHSFPTPYDSSATTGHGEEQAL